MISFLMLLELAAFAHWGFNFLVPLVDIDSVMCTAIYLVAKLFLTQLPHDRQEQRQLCLEVVFFPNLAMA